MTLLNIFTLEDTKEKDVISSLSEGEHIIGRGVTLNCNDKRISRKHALIVVCKDIVTIKAVHINPCFYKAADGNSITILPKDTSIELNDGDQFALLADLFWFKVRVILDKEDQSANNHDLKDVKNILKETNDRKTETFNLVECTNNNGLPPAGKRYQEENLTETSKRQKISVGNENKPSTSTSSDENVPCRLSSPNSLDLLLDTSPNLEQNIESNQLINNLNDILEEDYGTGEEKSCLENTSNENKSATDIDVKEEKQETKDNQERLDDDEGKNMSGIKISTSDGNVPQVKKESIDVAIKKEVSDSESDDVNKAEENKISKSEISNSNELPLNKMKKENIDGTSESKSNENAENATKNIDSDLNEASCSKDDSKDNQNKKKSRRERCWYAHTCYRKNPVHIVNFSHPGDDDFLSDPDDDRPICPFGDTCYRTNLIHRRDYRHSSRPAPKPNDGGGNPKRKSPKKKRKTSDGDSEDEQNDDGTRKKRKAATNKLYADHDSEDDYDYNDPFIDDASSDEFQLYSDDDDQDSTDWEDSQKVNEESQETRRLLKEAKRFTKNKPKKD